MTQGTMRADRQHFTITRSWALIAVGLIACAAIYVAALEFRGSRGLTSRDSVQYWQIGTNVADGNGFSFDGEKPTRMRQPVYPLIIAAMVRAFGDIVWPVQLLQLLLAMLTVVVTAAIAGELFGERAAGWAGLAAGLYYPFPVIATEIRTESVFIILLAVGVLLGLRAVRLRSLGCAAACGLFLGLAALTRAPGVAFIAMVPLGAWAALRRSERSWHEPLAMVAVALLLMLPWGVRNYLQLGEFEIMSNAGPVSIYVGTHPLAISAWGDYFRTVEKTDEYQRLLGDGPYLGEGPRRRFAEAVEKRFREDPWGIAWRGVVKIGLTWTYAPGSRPMILHREWLFRVLQVPQILFLLLIIYGAGRGGERAWIFAIALFLGTSSAMFLGAPTARYTLPFMPLGMALAAWGLLQLTQDSRTTNEPREQDNLNGPNADE